ncbi:hypothetical protein [Dyadobacter tibetensis]|uniref:hypothetical protein n=1 Tax=Dyadobacter tibetensis TaxID=1211851 RepID=UPI0004725E3C|nr:hypothetical protein [Dyadobacter tibetensis]
MKTIHPTTIQTASTYLKQLLSILLLLLSLVNSSAQTTSWHGSSDNDWHNGANWTAGVPNANLSAVIGKGAISPVIVENSIAQAKSVLVESNATLNIQPEASLIIHSNAPYSSPFPLTAGLYNRGTILHSGNIFIGLIPNTDRIYGIINQGSLVIEQAGHMAIDRYSDTGIYNVSSAIFTNKGTLNIGSTNAMGVHGIFNESSFSNNGGIININNTSIAAIRNVLGSFSNSGNITLGAVAGVGTFGIRNDATFNHTAGIIQIDRATEASIYHVAGIFNNTSNITIATLEATNNIHGILSQSSFNNNAGHIWINRASHNAISHVNGTFNNQASLTIGALGAIGIYGIKNNGIFNNNEGGKIKIDDCTETGIYNATAGILNNMDLITIGSDRRMGVYGVFNEAQAYNKAGSILINHAHLGAIHNASTGEFSNQALIKIGEIETGKFGIRNEKTFTNLGGGEIFIYKADDISIYNIAGGDFSNEGNISIEGGGSIDWRLDGIRNDGNFKNKDNAQIKIDNVPETGIYINGENAVFNNDAMIAIAGLENSLEINTGIDIQEGEFHNNESGRIQIDNTKKLAISQSANSGIFYNSGEIIIGGSKKIGDAGIRSQTEFHNDVKGTIKINRTQEEGIRHYKGHFKNSGTLIIGESVDANKYGIIAYSGLFLNESGGMITINNIGKGGVYLFDKFENSGTLLLGSASNINYPLIGNSTGIFTNNSGGTVRGTGTIQASTSRFVHNGGHISPGYSPGIMSFNGSTNFNNSILNIEVNGTDTEGIDFDQIVVSETATLGGHLNVSVGYAPTDGDAIIVLRAASISGTFETVELPSGNWSVDYTSTEVKLIYTDALPVTLVSFSTHKEGASLRLEWRTISEMHNQGFSIEHSADGVHWYEIGFVPGKGSGAQVVDYTFVDEKPRSGNNYYRLKQMDVDGKTQYSRVRHIHYESSDSDIIVWVDASRHVHILTRDLFERVTVSNLYGQVLANSEVNTVDLSHAPAGMLLARVQTVRGMQTKKFVLR